jgi:hypothetical protein
VDKIVRKITVDLVTDHAKESAAARGMVFLGLGGREFRLDIPDYDDFDQGDHTIYELGEGANVSTAERNDPRTGYQLTAELVAARPAYIRFEPQGRMLASLESRDDWHLAEVRVRVLVGQEELRFSALDGPQESIWLGLQSGLILYLDRQA